jgi:hypothetical protein
MVAGRVLASLAMAPLVATRAAGKGAGLEKAEPEEKAALTAVRIPGRR